MFPATSRDGRQSEVKASEGTCEQSEALTEREGWYDNAEMQREGALLPFCLRGERPVSLLARLHDTPERRKPHQNSIMGTARSAGDARPRSKRMPVMEEGQTEDDSGTDDVSVHQSPCCTTPATPLGVRPCLRRGGGGFRRCRSQQRSSAC